MSDPLTPGEQADADRAAEMAEDAAREAHDERAER